MRAPERRPEGTVIDPQPDTEPPKTLYSARTALGWGVACALCAGGVWLAGFLMLDVRIELPNYELLRRLPDAAIVIAVTGALGGVFGGLYGGLIYEASDPTPRVLVLGGAVVGAVGGALTIPTVILCREVVNPLTSSTLLWCAIGYFTGRIAYRLSLWWSKPAVPSVPDDEDDWAAPRHGRERNGAQEWVRVRLLPVLAMATVGFSVLFTILSTRY
jgi:hypothetical protein